MIHSHCCRDRFHPFDSANSVPLEYQDHMENQNWRLCHHGVGFCVRRPENCYIAIANIHTGVEVLPLRVLFWFLA
jgi:hypothetical protein